MLENLKNGLQNEENLGFINPMWEIEVIKKVQSEKGLIIEQVTKLPFLYIIHQYLKDYGFNPNIKEGFIVVVRIGSGAEIKLALFLEKLPDGWQAGQDVPEGVIYDNRKPVSDEG